MNIMSCKNCGVVLDLDVLNFEIKYDEDGVITEDSATWTGNDFAPAGYCPHCKWNIDENGEVT